MTQDIRRSLPSAARRAEVTIAERELVDANSHPSTCGGPTASIILPAYNEAAALPSVLDSLRADTSKHPRFWSIRSAASVTQILPWITGLVFLILGGIYFLVRPPVLHLNDASLYVMAAQAIVEGDGLRLISYQSKPPDTHIPPGYSLVLAAVFTLLPHFPTNLSLMQFLNLLAFYGLLGLSAIALRRCYHAHPLDVALAIILVASSSTAYWMSTAVLSDSFYGVLTLGSVLLVRAGWERRGLQGMGLLIAAALLATFAYYTRVVGIILILALAVDAIRRAHSESWWRVAVMLLPGVLALPWVGWMIWGSLNLQRGYLWGMIHGTPAWQEGPAVGIEHIIGHMFVHLLIGMGFVQSTVPVAAVVPGLALLSAPIYALILWQSWRKWWHTGEVIHLYLLLYLSALLPWVAPAGGRYIWPVAAIFAWSLVVGTRTICGYARARTSLRSPFSADTLVIAALLLSNGLLLADTVAPTNIVWRSDSLAINNHLRDLEQTANYLRGLEPATASLGTNHYGLAPWLYLYTGRTALDAVATADAWEPLYTRRDQQGNPETITYFVWVRNHNYQFLDDPDNGMRDLPVVLATLAARGASTEPLYCADGGSACVYDWRPQVTR